LENLSYTGHRQDKYFEWIAVVVLAYGLVVFYFGIVTVALASLLYKLKPSRFIYAVLTSISLLWLFFLLSKQDGLSYFKPCLLCWYKVPLFPIASLCLSGVVMFSKFSRPKSLEEQLEERKKAEEERQRRLSTSAERRGEIEGEGALIRLGSKVRGQTFPPHLGIYNKNDWVVLNEEVLDQHLFVLGTTGSGKSETIKRLVYEILKATDRNIYLVDGKGDEGLANDIRGLAYQHGRGKAPVFKLGFDKAGAVYDGFRGQPTDVYNRLCALVGTADAEGDAQYYADINRDLLQLVCYAPAGPPRSFEELRTRLNKEWLEEAYKDDETELSDIRRLDGREIEGLLHRLRPLAREFSKHVGDGGFALEETRCAIFSLRVQSVGDTAQRFLDFLVEDLKDFIGKRQTRPAVLIIDEFGQFSNKNITALLSLARSAKLAIILATQDVASLKDEQTKKLVLANTRTKILMATEFPEELAELAGTILRLENSIQFQEGEVTGRGSARIQHQFAVDPNEVAKLKPGEAFIIRQRHHAKIKVRAIGEVEHIEEQKEELRQKKTTPKKPEEKQPKRKAKRL
jgi:Cdc6-like AAA superfamily ATPase